MVECNLRLAPGPGVYFFTVRLQDAGSDLLTRHIDLLRLSVRLCQFRHPFVVEDAVILPDRLHTIWSLPPRDDDFAVRWQIIKATFAQHLPARPLHNPQPADGSPARAGRSIWQRRFWERSIATLADLAECRDLIRQAPVRAGLVADPADWPYSKVNRATRQAARGAKVVPLRLIDGSR